jgi:polysaccharide biosynthesis transport protein
MRKLVDYRLKVQSEVDSLSLTLTEKHPNLRRAKSNLAAVEARVKAHAEAWLKTHGGLPMLGGLAGAGGISPEQLPVVKQSLANYQEALKALQERNRELSMARTKVDELQADIKKRTEEYDTFERRLNAIRIENPTGDSGNAGRIQVISKGEEPTRPYSDPRFKLGALGFALGGGIPIGLVLLVGLLDRRYRYSDDASTPGQVSLLGILPYLPENMADPEQAAIAAHCVHQIRTLLQIGGAHNDRKVFTVTSPTSGDGKTSLSLSLGLSFAASGSRTLLVDFDLVGGGLSSAMQARTDRGVLDAILKGELNGHIVSTAFPRLSILPTGEDEAQEVSRLSPSLVRKFLDQAREQYDVVVIDTGPILGSLEASLVSSESDGVILALGRGQQRHQVERAVNHLASVGAKLVGVVFNRAQPGDFRRAVSSASVRSVPVNMNGNGRASMPALGPMARTVASHIHSGESEGNDL